MENRHSSSPAAAPHSRGHSAEGMGSFWVAVGIVVLSIAMILTRADVGSEVEIRGEPLVGAGATGPDAVPYLPSLYGTPAANVEPPPPTF